MGTIDIDFGKLRECDAIVIGAKAMYVVIGPWSLATKLVAREIKNDEAPILVSFINSFKVCILRSITTLRGSVDNKEYLTSIHRKRDTVAIAGFNLELVNVVLGLLRHHSGVWSHNRIVVNRDRRIVSVTGSKRHHRHQCKNECFELFHTFGF